MGQVGSSAWLARSDKESIPLSWLSWVKEGHLRSKSILSVQRRRKFVLNNIYCTRSVVSQRSSETYSMKIKDRQQITPVFFLSFFFLNPCYTKSERCEQKLFTKSNSFVRRKDWSVRTKTLRWLFKRAENMVALADFFSQIKTTQSWARGPRTRTQQVERHHDR